MTPSDGQDGSTPEYINEGGCKQLPLPPQSILPLTETSHESFAQELI